MPCNILPFLQYKHSLEMNKEACILICFSLKSYFEDFSTITQLCTHLSQILLANLERRSLAKSGYKWDPLYRTPLTFGIYLPFSFVQQLTLPFSPPDIGVEKLLFTSNSTFLWRQRTHLKPIYNCQQVGSAIVALLHNRLNKLLHPVVHYRAPIC
jgi:hypothetical protein